MQNNFIAWQSVSYIRNVPNNVSRKFKWSFICYFGNITRWNANEYTSMYYALIFHTQSNVLRTYRWVLLYFADLRQFCAICSILSLFPIALQNSSIGLLRFVSTCRTREIFNKLCVHWAAKIKDHMWCNESLNIWDQALKL